MNPFCRCVVCFLSCGLIHNCRYDLGTLAAGESKSVTVSTAATSALFTATATADVIAADGSAVQAYKDAKVSAAGSLTVQTLTAEAFAAYEAAEAVAEAAKLGYIPRPDFEVKSISFVNGAPTITGEVFSVVAKIRNVGETAAYPGKVALFVSHADIVGSGETPDAVMNTTRCLREPPPRFRAGAQLSRITEKSQKYAPQKLRGSDSTYPDFTFSDCVCGGILLFFTINALIVFLQYAAGFRSGGLIRNCHERGVF